MSSPSQDGNSSPRQQFRYRFENAEFDEAAVVLRVDGEVVNIEPRPLSLLGELLAHTNEVVTKEELFDSVWLGRPTVDNVLPTAINRLRNALGEAAARRIVNVPRVGYRLDGPIERVAIVAGEAVLEGFEAGRPVPGHESYQLLNTLGHTGKNNVWLARHAKLGHLRVFKFAHDADELRGIKREFTLCRVLKEELGDKAGFVGVIDANFTEPPFSLEFEYGGEDLLQWAQVGERLSAMPTEERIALFLQIARAVAAAHSVGVLHKDLKPANVLVQPVPVTPDTPDKTLAWQVQLADFGSGRALDIDRLRAIGVTALGLTLTQGVDADSLSGTPLYLAPELFAGAAPTTQSDIYALGIMLYQLLAGDLRKPMVTGWQKDVGDELLVQDVADATQGQPAVRLKSVADLIGRLQSIDERKTELKRLAQVNSAYEAAQADLLIRRSRRPWVWGAFVSLLVGLVAAIGLYANAIRAQTLASEEALRASVINAFLNKDVLQAADVTRVADLKADTLFDVLTRASAKAGLRFHDLPRTEAAVRNQLGAIFLRLARAGKARDEFLQAVKLLAPLVEKDHPEYLVAQLGLVRAQVGSYEYDAASKTLALAQSNAASGLSGLTGGTQVLATRAELDLLLAQNKNKESLPIALRLVELTSAWREAEVTDLFDAHQLLAETYLRLNETDKAKVELKLLFNPPYDVAGVGEVSLARARISQARMLREEGKDAQALSILLDVRNVLVAALGPTALQVGYVCYELAGAYMDSGDLAQGRSNMEIALRAFEIGHGPEHGNTVSAKLNLAISDLMQGRATEALAIFNELGSVAERLGAGASIALYRATALNDLGRGRESLEIIDKIQADDVAKAHLGADDWKWKLQAERGMALVLLGRKTEGRPLIVSALAEIKKRDLGPNYEKRYGGFLARSWK